MGYNRFHELAELFAARHGWKKTGDHPRSRVVVYQRHEKNGQNRMLLNIYYTTQTVGSALDHPSQGKTQLFRREVSESELEEIFINPRSHRAPGRPQGYQRVNASGNQASQNTQQKYNCILCGRGGFKSAAGSVMHVESGRCTHCMGVDNARQGIYQFARTQPGMKGYMQLSLEDNRYGGNTRLGDDDKPYCCSQCPKTFRQLSQLMQHLSDKHQGNSRLMLGNGY